ncbi:uncharacterized protein LOC130734375 [Lotus japonicus]|uniref:uncharacterized protein LOC130734375 n=1 Tax=Lotus japonicus TaxID=34305 RepID=UPI002590F1C8|nr:uncharacterized protein LOC130734375 [Lotus japonicus]
MVFTLVVRHGGWFGSSPYWHYFGGAKSEFHDLDESKWSYSKTVEIVKGLGYKEFDLLWLPDEDVDWHVFRNYTTDMDAKEFAKYAVGNDHEGVIFVDNLSKDPPTLPTALKEKKKDANKNVKVQKLRVRKSGRFQAMVRQGTNKGPPEVVELSDDEQFPNEVAMLQNETVLPEPVLLEAVIPEPVIPNVVDPKVAVPEVVDGVDGDKAGEDNQEEENDDSDVSEVDRVDDSEEERDLAKGEEVTNPGFAQAESLLNEHITQMLQQTAADNDDGEKRDETDLCGGYESEDLESVPTDSEQEGIPRRRFERFNEDDMGLDFKFTLGMEFISLTQFKEALTDYCMKNNREYKFKKNDSKRCRVVCLSDGCPFVILCSKVGNKQTYRIKTLKGEHTCARVFDNKSANVRWVKKNLLNKIRTVNKISTNEIVDDFRVNLGIGITRYRAWKGKKLATEEVDGAAEMQYTLLWRFSNELRRRDAGNTCKINFVTPRASLHPRFLRFYMCLEGCKRGFLGGCRPFIGLDGCHLKTKHGGILLSAVARDPNEEYFPLAFAVVESENKDSWRWFMELLMDDIDPTRSSRWCFISDQQKGLMEVFKEELLQGCDHRLCVRHLYANLKTKFGGGVLLRNLMMAAAKATYEEEWREKMQLIKEKNLLAFEWLMEKPTSSWCSHAFSIWPKCDVIMNNLSESFNAAIILARDKPILTMMEWIRTYVMGRFPKMMEKLNNWTGQIMPKPLKRIGFEVGKSKNWIPRQVGNEKFEVRHAHTLQRHVVSLRDRKCSCKFWEINGFPCRHAVCGINFKGYDPKSYVDDCYKRGAFKATYEHEITPLPGPDQWIVTPNDPECILPPLFKRGAGRPKKLRRRDPYDDPNPNKLKRGGAFVRCSRCNQYGHNKKGCKNPIEEEIEIDAAELDAQMDAVLEKLLETESQQATAAPAPCDETHQPTTGQNKKVKKGNKRCSVCKQYGHYKTSCKKYPKKTPQ